MPMPSMNWSVTTRTRAFLPACRCGHGRPCGRDSFASRADAHLFAEHHLPRGYAAARVIELDGRFGQDCSARRGTLETRSLDSDQPQQLVRVDRLHQVMVETGGRCARAVLLLAVAG